MQFSPVFFPILGNEATGFMVIFSVIADVVGAASCLSGLHHLRVWTAESLASNTASAMSHDNLGSHTTRLWVLINYNNYIFI